MADKHSLNYDVRELKLGASFTNNKTSQYHTIKYDFKPASVDVNKMATVDVGTNNQVTVTVPHLDGAGVPQTVFKGSQRPYTKECVLIIDRVTGEITLEKLSSNIQVKKTRQENAQKPRPLTPVTNDFTNTTARSSSRTRVATNRRTHSAAVPGPAGGAPASSQPRFNGAAPGAGAGASKQPQSMVRSPTRVRTSPPQAAPWAGGGNSTLASLPMIGLDDAPGPAPPPAQPSYPPPAQPSYPPPAQPSYPPPVQPSYPPPARPDRPSERPDRLPDRADRPPDRADRLPDRADRLPDRADRLPDRADRLPDRADRLPDRADRLPDRADRLPDRADRLPDRADRVPDRLERAYQPERSVPPVERPHQVNHAPAPSVPAPAARQQDSSSSSSSESGSDSDTGSDSDNDSAHRVLTNGTSAATNPALPRDVLNDDLCLSESGSDSE